MNEDDNKLVEERREKLKALRAQGHRLSRTTSAASTSPPTCIAASASTSKEELEKAPAPAKVAGRMMLKRVMGKASFATLQDGSGPHPGLRHPGGARATRTSSTGTSATSSASKAISSRR